MAKRSDLQSLADSICRLVSQVARTAGDADDDAAGDAWDALTAVLAILEGNQDG
ncbi:MAG: hypothetical protein WCJ35_24280 [Planctomycetota bacterium]